MNPIFVRFGLPWLIFGSAVFALYWAIWHGDSGIYYEQTAHTTTDVSRREIVATSEQILQQQSNTPPSHSNAQSVAIPAAVGAASSATHEQQRTVATDRVTQVSEDVPAVKVVLTTETNIQQALQDVDPKIRYHALAQSEAQGIAIPTHTLQQLATSDRDPTIRVLAMTKYSQDPAIDPALIRAVAEAGLRDRDTSVSAHARAMLEQLDHASGMNDEIAQLPPEDMAQ